MSEDKETKVEEPKAEEKAPAPEVTAAVKKAVEAVMGLSADERKAFVVEYLSGLSVLELNDQVKALEDFFGVSAAPVGMMMPQAPGAGDFDSKGTEAKSGADTLFHGPSKRYPSNQL